MTQSKTLIIGGIVASTVILYCHWEEATIKTKLQRSGVEVEDNEGGDWAFAASLDSYSDSS
jgi:hypothetical protein